VFFVNFEETNIARMPHRLGGGGINFINSFEDLLKTRETLAVSEFENCLLLWFYQSVKNLLRTAKKKPYFQQNPFFIN
jgi:hypothetical protein